MGNLSSSPKFYHNWNGPMQKCTNIDSITHGGSGTNTIRYLTADENFAYGLVNEFGAKRILNRFKFIDFGSGDPHPGRASVDSGGSLSYSGSGFTYMFRLPSVGTKYLDEQYDDDSYKVRSDDDRIFASNGKAGAEHISYPIQIIIDKNSEPGYYLHTPTRFNPNDTLYVGVRYYMKGSEDYAIVSYAVIGTLPPNTARAGAPPQHNGLLDTQLPWTSTEEYDAIIDYANDTLFIPHLATLQAAAIAATPAVNSSKLTSGDYFRDAKIAQEVYSDTSVRLATIEGFSYVLSQSTAENAVYVNNSSQIVIISLRGTMTSGDVETDLRLMAGSLDERFTSTKNFYLSIRDNPTYSGYTIMAVGHSLGGALGIYLNYNFGIPISVFNPAVANSLFNNNPHRSNATAHIVKGDVVSGQIGVFTTIVSTLKVYPTKNLLSNALSAHHMTNFY